MRDGEQITGAALITSGRAKANSYHSMTRSAVRLRVQSDATCALLVMAHPNR